MPVLKKSSASKGKLYTSRWRKRILQPEGMWLKILLLSFYDLGTLVHWLKNPDGKAGLESKSLVLTPAGGGDVKGERGWFLLPVLTNHSDKLLLTLFSSLRFLVRICLKKRYLWKKTKNLKTLVFSPLTCMSLQMLSFYIAENTGWRSKRAHLPQVPN